MEKYSDFIISWQENTELWSAVFLGLAILVLFFYATGLMVSKNRSNLYEYVSTHETPALMNFFVMLSLSLTFFVNSHLIGQYKTFNNFMLIMQTVSAVAIGGIFYYTLRLLLKYYYPSILAKHLSSIRFAPRLSSSGNPMTLMNEDEEDLHLTQEQIEHEEIFAYDYDVWIDDATGEKVIEKYDIHHTNQVCDECRLRTLREINEEVVKAPTAMASGEIIKHYKCDYCGHKEAKTKVVAPLEPSETVHAT